MLRLGMSSEQLSRTRFAVSPSLHLASILRMRIRRERLPGWVERRLGAVDHQQAAPLLDLALPGGRYLLDLITPLPVGLDSSFEEELDAVRATPADVVRQQLGFVYRLGPVLPGFAAAMMATREEADAWRTEPSEAARTAYEGEVEPFLDQLAGALRHVWDTVLAPRWPDIRQVARTDVLHRSMRAAESGMVTAVLELMSVASWDGSTAVVASSSQVDLTGWSGEIVLSPVVFLESDPVTCACGRDVMVGYPCRGRGLVGAAGPPRTDASAEGLPGVLGATRHRLLGMLAEPQPGHALAGRLALSPATVSYHLARLHRVGLVERRRLGREVVYRRTELADNLLPGDAGRPHQR